MDVMLCGNNKTGVTKMSYHTGFTYEIVQWNHSFKDEPIRIFAELDSARYEMRKIEIFRDKSYRWVNCERQQDGTTSLAEKPWPNLDQINSDNEFLGKLISKEEFEKEWLYVTTQQEFDE